MSLDNQNRAEMIRLHIEKVHQNLADADLLYDSGSISAATGRLYYSVFHAVHALFIANGIVAKTHHGMNHQFNDRFVKTGLFDPIFGRLIARLENMREKAEYDVVFTISRDQYEAIKPTAIELIEQIEKNISDSAFGIDMQ